VSLRPYRAICNTDGDELVITTVRYPLKAEVSADASGVRSQRSQPCVRKARRSGIGLGSQKRSGTRRAGKHAFITTTLDDGSAGPGDVGAEGQHAGSGSELTPTRAKRGRALIEPAIGELVGEPLIEAKTAAVADLPR
jgi:hypothetical protein